MICRLTLIILTIWSMDALALPAWFKNGSKMDGHIYTTTCQGIGLSVDNAREESINSCKASAISQLPQDMKFKVISIQTENDSTLHKEISSEQKLKNLRCNILKEEVEEKEDQFTVYNLCKFDLSKTEIEAVQSNSKDNSFKQRLENLNSISERQISSSDRNYKMSDKKSISLSVIGGCSKILARGETPRVISCRHNPVLITLEPGDKEFIIESPGHISKSIQASDLLNSEDETFQAVMNE